MTRLLILLLSVFCVVSAYAGPKPKQRILPQTQAELKIFLIDSTWIADGKADHAYSFRENGIFEGTKSMPTYEVTGRRTVTIMWGAATKIPCLITEDCATMIEMAGARHTYVRK